MQWQLFQTILELALPNHCLNCDRQAPEMFCQACLEKLLAPKIRIFKQKNQSIKVVSILRYERGTEKLIKSKFVDKPENFIQVAKIVATGMSTTAGIINWNDYIFCPVPCHWSRLISRGFNQSEILSQAITQKLNLRHEKILEKVLPTESQASKTKRTERFANLYQCFKISDVVCKNGLIDKQSKIVLVDDLVTSGATLLQCAKTIKEAFGCQEVIALTISAKAL